MGDPQPPLLFCVEPALNKGGKAVGNTSWDIHIYFLQVQT